MRWKLVLAVVGLGLGPMLIGMAACAAGDDERADCFCVDQRTGEQTTTPNLTREQCGARETVAGEKVRACQTPLGEVRLGRPELGDLSRVAGPNDW
jgi:hypothetical protein